MEPPVYSGVCLDTPLYSKTLVTCLFSEYHRWSCASVYSFFTIEAEGGHSWMSFLAELKARVGEKRQGWSIGSRVDARRMLHFYLRSLKLQSQVSNSSTTRAVVHIKTLENWLNLCIKNWPVSLLAAICIASYGNGGELGTSAAQSQPQVPHIHFGRLA